MNQKKLTNVVTKHLESSCPHQSGPWSPDRGCVDQGGTIYQSTLYLATHLQGSGKQGCQFSNLTVVLRRVAGLNGVALRESEHPNDTHTYIIGFRYNSTNLYSPLIMNKNYLLTFRMAPYSYHSVTSPERETSLEAAPAQMALLCILRK